MKETTWRHRQSRAIRSARLPTRQPKSGRTTTRSATTAAMTPRSQTIPSSSSWVRGNHRNSEARVYREKGRALTRPCSQLTEGCEKGNYHRCRVLRGTYHGGRFGSVVHFGLRDERVAVYTSVRGQLDRSECSVLGWVADGRQLHAGVRRQLLPTMGNSRSLARVGTARRRKERLPGAGMESLAEHSPNVQTDVEEGA